MSYLRVFRSKLTIFVPLLVALVIGVACGSDPTATPIPTAEPTNTPSPTAEPTPTVTPEITGIRGGSYPIINSGFPARWDPHLAATLPEIGAISPLYNQVVEFNPINPSEIIGDLAKGWKASDDGMSYTFTLNEGVKWSDGSDLTSEDVAFSINRMIQEGEPRPRAGLLRTSTKNAEVVDSNTVKVNLHFPDASFLPFLAVDFMKVVPKGLVEGGVDINVWDNIVGSGPYLKEEIARGNFSRHKRNPNYFKEGRPFFDEMTVFVFADAGAAAAAIETGQILGSTAGLTVDVEGIFELAKKLEGTYTLYFTPMNSGTHIMANVEKEPWTDLRVLSALKMATDQQEILDAFDAGGTHSYGAPFPVGSWYGSTVEELGKLPGFGGIVGSSRTKDQDIADAKALLKEAGYDPPSKLGKITLTVTSIIWFPDVSQLWQEQMRRNLGVEVELKSVDFATGFNDLQSGNFELGVFGYAYNISDPNDYVRAIYGPIARNYSRWKDADFQALFESQARETDIESRTQILRQMEAMLLSRSPYVEIFWINNRYFISNRIQTEAGSFVPPESIQTVLKQEHLWLAP